MNRRLIHDYKALEQEFLTADPPISLRELCRRHDIKGFSAVAKYAREHDWYGRLDKIKDRRDERVIEKIAESQADEMTVVRSEWLKVIQASIYRFANQLRDDDFIITVPDLLKLMDKGLLLMGEPTKRTEERHLGVSIAGSLEGLPRDVLADLLGAVRSARDDARPVGPALPAPSEGRRSN